jgi:heme-degrading monooxygenase HmoA
MSGERYTYIWEYEVTPGREREFLAHYAPEGTWARLFRRADGYLSTELYRDRTRPGRFLTIDHWRSEAAFRKFRREFMAEFEALDRECGALTLREALLGELRPASAELPRLQP